MMAIGYIVEGWRDKAFLNGLSQRKGWCTGAQILEGRYPGRGRASLLRELAQTCKGLRSRGARFIVVLLDADREDWGEVRKRATDRIPANVRDFTILGVAAENIEDWLNTDPGYLAERTGIPIEELQGGGKAERGLDRALGGRSSLEGEDRIAAMVRDAPFRRWIERSPSFERFYEDARNLAQQSGVCAIPNEREA